MIKVKDEEKIKEEVISKPEEKKPDFMVPVEPISQPVSETKVIIDGVDNRK